MKVWTILIVVCAFGAAFSGYWTVASAHPSASTPSTLYNYLEDSQYSYLATLSPNSLYNTTTLTPGNGTLFTAITRWVNLTFDFALVSTAVVNVSTTGSFQVAITTSAWTKPIETVPLRAGVTDGTVESLVAAYALNVSTIGSIVRSIDLQTGFSPGYYSVVLTTSLASVVTDGRSVTHVATAPFLSLNFTAGQIRPSSFHTSSIGSVASSDPVVTPSLTAPALLPVGILIACLAGIVVAGWFLYLGYDGRIDDLPALMAPYQEAIVDVRGPPVASSTIPVKSWDDIVKVADTIGLPILRTVRMPIDGDASPTTVFYVVSAGTAYVFVHNPDDPTPTLPPGSVVPSGAAASATPQVTAWKEAYPRIPGADLGSLDSFVDWSDRLNRRIASFRPQSPVRVDAETLVLKAVGLARRGELDAAWTVLAQAYSRLGPWGADGRTPRGTRPLDAKPGR